MKNCRTTWLSACALSLFVATAMAASVHSDQDTKEDVARHRAISAAHEAAAKCLESGKKEEVCHIDLQAACKGLAIGKYCGMKHEH
ncbi:MAG: hypothetical protein RIS34_623 [Pseudomonadota bacterium]|jgi:hypothetical protein